MDLVGLLLCCGCPLCNTLQPHLRFRGTLGWWEALAVGALTVGVLGSYFVPLSEFLSYFIVAF